MRDLWNVSEHWRKALDRDDCHTSAWVKLTDLSPFLVPQCAEVSRGRDRLETANRSDTKWGDGDSNELSSLVGSSCDTSDTSEEAALGELCETHLLTIAGLELNIEENELLSTLYGCLVTCDTH